MEAAFRIPTVVGVHWVLCGLGLTSVCLDELCVDQPFWSLAALRMIHRLSENTKSEGALSGDGLETPV